MPDDLGDDLLVAAEIATGSARSPRPASACARRSASTCGTDRPRTAPTRRRRCRRGSRERCCARRSGPWAAAASAAPPRCASSCSCASRISASANSRIAGSAAISCAVLHVALAAAVGLVQLDHGRDFGVLARELAIGVHVGRDGLRPTAAGRAPRAAAESCASLPAMLGFIRCGGCGKGATGARAAASRSSASARAERVSRRVQELVGERVAQIAPAPAAGRRPARGGAAPAPSRGAAPRSAWSRSARMEGTSLAVLEPVHEIAAPCDR